MAGRVPNQLPSAWSGQVPTSLSAPIRPWRAMEELSRTTPDRRRERRPLNMEELRLLIDEAARGPVWCGMNGPDRAMLYCLAVGTGFRVSELRSLTPASFRLHADPPVVELRATDSKRRRDDVQPVRHDLAELLLGIR